MKLNMKIEKKIASTEIKLENDGIEQKGKEQKN